MKKYEDAWVVDRTMFDFFHQNGSDCCGMTHTIMEMAKTFEACSDWDTEEERQESLSIWPPSIHEQILSERARVRLALKQTMAPYEAFQNEHFQDFSLWWTQQSASTKSNILQISEDEIKSFFLSDLQVKGSYAILLNAILEQLRHYRETGYLDGRDDAEIVYEQHLKSQDEHFYVDKQYVVNKSEHFIDLLSLLAGPRLLPIREAPTPEAAEAEQEKSVANVQSFRSDRRLVRLVIARHFMDAAIDLYSSNQSN